MKSIYKRYSTINPKNKRIIKNTFLTFIVKAGATIISLLMLPAFMRFFDNHDILGLWFTALSMLSWFLVFDLGIGNGLRNYLVIAFTENNLDDVKKYISSSYIIIGSIVLTISLIGYVIIGYLDWNTILNVKKSVLANGTLILFIRILFIGIMMQFLLRLISSILMALQKPAIPNLITLISNILMLLFLLSIDKSSVSSNLIYLSYINFYTSTIPLFIVTIVVFKTSLHHFFPNLNYFSRQHASKIIKLGGTFFWIQMMYLIISNTNEFLINGLIGSKYVVDYKIYNSLFGLIGVLFSLVVAPIWSEVTEAFAKKEINWIKNLYKKIIKLGLLAASSLIILIFIMQMILDLWLKENAIKVNPTYSVIFAISTIMVIWTAIVSSFVNGLGKLKIQSQFLTIGALSNIILSIVLSNFFHVWIVIVISNILSLLPYCIVQTLWLNNYFKSNFI
jgi:O-antigen/teichoic acid export membrane protein